MIRQNSDAPLKKSTDSKVRHDLIFIAGILIFVSIAGLFYFLLRGEGDTVIVTVDGEIFGTYSLDEERTVEIRTGEKSENLNRLVIRDGEAFVEFATCPDGICAAHRPVSHDGESIVCLPHRVVITVHGTGDKEEPDVIA